MTNNNRREGERCAQEVHDAVDGTHLVVGRAAVAERIHANQHRVQHYAARPHVTRLRQTPNCRATIQRWPTRRNIRSLRQTTRENIPALPVSDWCFVRIYLCFLCLIGAS
eukprot:4085659-Pyramimonas_sp.AAC.1